MVYFSRLKHSFMPPSSKPRFLADAMLKNVVRWLRLLAVDCEFAGDLGLGEDEEILKYALKSRRILLTSDAQLHARGRSLVKCLFLPQAAGGEAAYPDCTGVRRQIRQAPVNLPPVRRENSCGKEKKRNPRESLPPRVLRAPQVLAVPSLQTNLLEGLALAANTKVGDENTGNCREIRLARLRRLGSC